MLEGSKHVCHESLQEEHHDWEVSVQEPDVEGELRSIFLFRSSLPSTDRSFHFNFRSLSGRSKHGSHRSALGSLFCLPFPLPREVRWLTRSSSSGCVELPSRSTYDETSHELEQGCREEDKGNAKGVGLVVDGVIFGVLSTG